MRQIMFRADAFEQYSDWATSDSKIFERIRRLIVEPAREPFLGSQSHLEAICAGTVPAHK